MSGRGQGLTYSLGHLPITIGRQNDSGIPLDDRKVSRHHAAIEETSPEGCYLLRDLDSTNCTYLNGEAISTAVLKDGDIIRIGSTELRFVLTPQESPRLLDPHAPPVTSREFDDISLEISPQTLDRALLASTPSSDSKLQHALYSIGMLAQADADVGQFLDAALAIAHGPLPFSASAWLEWNAGPAGDYDVPGQRRGDGDTGSVLLLSGSLIYRAITSARAVISSELPEQFETSMAGRSIPVSSALVVPLQVGEPGQCALYLERTSELPPFAIPDLEIAVVLASFLRSNLANLRLYRELGTAYENLDRYLGQLNKSERLAAVGRLAGGFAHDLNNPLSSVLGFLELAERLITREAPAELQPKLLKFIGKAHGAADFCRALSRNVLAFAREGSFDPSAANEIPVRKTVDSTLAMCDSAVRESGAEITVDIADDLVLHGDPSVLQQVVMNLITNAADALSDTSGRSARIEVSACSRDDDLILEVRDNGPGIPEKIRSRVFEPLFTTKEGARGTGLGLYVVNTLIERAGGRLELESETGRGATFRIHLPLVLTGPAHGDADGESAGDRNHLTPA